MHVLQRRIFFRQESSYKKKTKKTYTHSLNAVCILKTACFTDQISSGIVQTNSLKNNPSLARDKNEKKSRKNEL